MARAQCFTTSWSEGAVLLVLALHAQHMYVVHVSRRSYLHLRHIAAADICVLPNRELFFVGARCGLVLHRCPMWCVDADSASGQAHACLHHQVLHIHVMRTLLS